MHVPRLLKKINTEVKPKMQSSLGLPNLNMVPRIQKIVVNAGIRSDLKDAKIIEEYIADLKHITGQVPVKTRAKKSISSFKIRQGQTVGLMVTLRGTRMYEFLDKLLNVSLARIRDFRGLSEKGFDSKGNYSIGFRDQISFPEISADSVSHPFGIQVTIVVEAPTLAAAREFFKFLGFPLKKEDQ